MIDRFFNTILYYLKRLPEPDEEDDEDHGGLVKKIMESKKEYEQPRKTEIVRFYHFRMTV